MTKNLLAICLVFLVASSVVYEVQGHFLLKLYLMRRFPRRCMDFAPYAVKGMLMLMSNLERGCPATRHFKNFFTTFKSFMSFIVTTRSSSTNIDKEMNGRCELLAKAMTALTGGKSSDAVNLKSTMFSMGKTLVEQKRQGTRIMTLQQKRELIIAMVKWTRIVLTCVKTAAEQSGKLIDVASYGLDVDVNSSVKSGSDSGGSYPSDDDDSSSSNTKTQTGSYNKSKGSSSNTNSGTTETGTSTNAGSVSGTKTKQTSGGSSGNSYKDTSATTSDSPSGSTPTTTPSYPSSSSSGSVSTKTKQTSGGGSGNSYKDTSATTSGSPSGSTPTTTPSYPSSSGETTTSKGSATSSRGASSKTKQSNTNYAPSGSDSSDTNDTTDTTSETSSGTPSSGTPSSGTPTGSSSYSGGKSFAKGSATSSGSVSKGSSTSSGGSSSTTSSSTTSVKDVESKTSSEVMSFISNLEKKYSGNTDLKVFFDKLKTSMSASSKISATNPQDFISGMTSAAGKLSEAMMSVRSRFTKSAEPEAKNTMANCQQQVMNSLKELQDINSKIVSGKTVTSTQQTQIKQTITKWEKVTTQFVETAASSSSSSSSSYSSSQQQNRSGMMMSN